MKIESKKRLLLFVLIPILSATSILSPAARPAAPAGTEDITHFGEWKQPDFVPTVTKLFKRINEKIDKASRKQHKISNENPITPLQLYDIIKDYSGRREVLNRKATKKIEQAGLNDTKLLTLWRELDLRIATAVWKSIDKFITNGINPTTINGTVDDIERLADCYKNSFLPIFMTRTGIAQWSQAGGFSWEADNIQEIARATAREVLAKLSGSDSDTPDGSDGEEKELKSVEPANFSWLVEGEICGLARPQKAEELQYLTKKNVGLIVTLTAEEDLADTLFEGMTLERLFLPIEDFSVPTLEQADRFVSKVTETLKKGKAVAVHCLGGRGRTGTMLACWLVARQNMQPKEAVLFVRKKRPGSIETPEQVNFVTTYSEHLAKKKGLRASVGILTNEQRASITSAFEALNTAIKSGKRDEILEKMAVLSSIDVPAESKFTRAVAKTVAGLAEAVHDNKKEQIDISCRWLNNLLAADKKRATEAAAAVEGVPARDLGQTLAEAQEAARSTIELAQEATQQLKDDPKVKAYWRSNTHLRELITAAEGAYASAQRALSAMTTDNIDTQKALIEVGIDEVFKNTSAAQAIIHELTLDVDDDEAKGGDKKPLPTEIGPELLAALGRAEATAKTKDWVNAVLVSLVTKFNQCVGKTLIDKQVVNTKTLMEKIKNKLVETNATDKFLIVRLDSLIAKLTGNPDDSVEVQKAFKTMP